MREKQSFKDSEKDSDDRSSKKTNFNRKKACRFCADSDYVLDYKDAKLMQSYISEHGKIVPRRISGNCSMHQRKITTAIKRARNLALVGYVSMGY